MKKSRLKGKRNDYEDRVLRRLHGVLPEDVQVTRHIVEAGNLLDIEVLDHLIIGQGRYVSLKERGLGFG